ncbi:MAG: hypothetical protein ABIR11_08850 [Candidatus Limnocylindrales bacterium]
MTGAPGPALDQRNHRRARDLAASRPDGFLTPDEAAWLDGHLAGCEACTLVAGSYAGQRDLFAAARAGMPVPPRDLWARTAAAIEAEGRPKRAHRGAFHISSWVYAPLAGMMVVAIAVGASLLNGLPAKESTSKGEEPDATPFAMAAGEIQVVGPGADGTYEFSRQLVGEVCPISATSCGLALSPEITQRERLTTRAAYDAIISPNNDQIVVVERGSGSQGVYVVPVRATGIEGPSAPPGSAAPTAVATLAATASPSETPSGTPAASSQPSASLEPSASAPVPSDAASSTPAASDLAASDPPAPTPDPSASASAAPTPEPATPQPTVAVTPRPDGALEIARDVVMVGNTAAYSADGARFAFSARPSDGSTGPDVYVWSVGERLATAVTADHASLFSGWLDESVLVSRVVGGQARTIILDLSTGDQRSAHGGPMWRPTVGPDARTGVWWDGTLKPTPDGHSWLPDAGRLVLEAWPDGSASQVIADGRITDWQVRWDPSGKLLALWTTTGGPGDAGTLALYTVDPSTGRADLANAKLAPEPAFDGFSIRKGRLTWSAPADGSDTTVQVLAWSGDRFGRLEILAEDGTTVVR